MKLFHILIFVILGIQGCSAQTAKIINVREKGVYPSNTSYETDAQKYERWLKINNLFHLAVKQKSNLYFPKGMYDVGDRNFPFRKPEVDLSDTLMDCNNIVIYGENGTIFRTSSKNGADVLQLNKIKNIKFKNLSITALLYNYQSSGTNGISVTNGFDNIAFENITIYDLPGVDKGYWIDGGKGLTVQSEEKSKAYKGKIIAKNLIVQNCAYGFRMDTNELSTIMDSYKTFKLDLEISVINAFQGISFEFGPSSKNIIDGAKLDINITASLKDCQQYVNFVRVIGGDYNIKLQTTKNYNQKLINNKGILWSSKDGRVLGFLSGYTKNSTVKITGDVGDVDNKIRIGVTGNSLEKYNLINRTENNIFKFDIVGNSLLEDINVVSFNKESLNNNDITVSKQTTGKLPTDFNRRNNKLN